MREFHFYDFYLVANHLHGAAAIATIKTLLLTVHTATVKTLILTVPTVAIK